MIFSYFAFYQGLYQFLRAASFSSNHPRSSPTTIDYSKFGSSGASAFVIPDNLGARLVSEKSNYALLGSIHMLRFTCIPQTLISPQCSKTLPAVCWWQDMQICVWWLCGYTVPRGQRCIRLLSRWRPERRPKCSGGCIQSSARVSQTHCGFVFAQRNVIYTTYIHFLLIPTQICAHMIRYGFLEKHNLITHFLFQRT